MNNLNKLYCQNMSEFVEWLKDSNFTQEEIGDWLTTSNKLHNKSVGFYQILAKWCLVAADSRIAAEKEKRA